MILKNDETLRCPECGGGVFLATAHVTQDWEIGESGQFLSCVNDCVETVHEPGLDDLLTCKNCGHEAEGRSFVTRKDP